LPHLWHQCLLGSASFVVFEGAAFIIINAMELGELLLKTAPFFPFGHVIIEVLPTTQSPPPTLQIAVSLPFFFFRFKFISRNLM